MLIYGLQNNGNPTLVEVISAEIEIYEKTINFKTACGDIWKLPFDSQSDARMKLISLKNKGILVLDNLNDPNYMLRKG